MDLVKIANACAVECERQQVGIRELGFLLEAYEWLVISHAEVDINFFEILGSFVEPGKNRNGFRRLPVTFANGGSSAPASEIPRLMEQLVENIRVFLIDPPVKVAPNSMAVSFDGLARALVKEFLWIHPFADGNGRCAFLLYNYLMGTLDSPLPLPDFGW